MPPCGLTAIASDRVLVTVRKCAVHSSLPAARPPGTAAPAWTQPAAVTVTAAVIAASRYRRIARSFQPSPLRRRDPRTGLPASHKTNPRTRACDSLRRVNGLQRSGILGEGVTNGEHL